MDNSRVKSSVKNIYFALFSQIIIIVLNYICRIVFVRTLSQEYLGVSGLFSNILTVLSLADLGLGSVIVYAMYAPIVNNDEEKIKSYMSFYRKCYNTISLVVFIIGISLLPNLEFFINNDHNIKNIGIIYFLYLIDTVFSYMYVYKSAILNATQKVYIINFYRALTKIFMSIVMIVSLIIFKNFFIYLVIQISFNLLSNILISRKANKLYPYIQDKKVKKLDEDDRKSIIKNVYALSCNQIGHVLINGTDNVIISKFINIVAVGLYSNYYMIIGTLSGLVGQIFNSIISVIGNISAKEEKSKVYNVFKKVFFGNFIIALFSTTILIACINDFIIISFGKQYLLDTYTVAVILINFYILSMKNVVGTFKYSVGIFLEDRYCHLINAVINVILSIILVNQCGIIGVFLGTLISDLLTSFWYQPYILYKKGFEISAKKYVKLYVEYTIIFIISSAALILILNNINLSISMLSLVVKALIAVTINVVIIIAIYRKNSNYIYFKNIVMNFIKKSCRKILNH